MDMKLVLMVVAICRLQVSEAYKAHHSTWTYGSWINPYDGQGWIRDQTDGADTWGQTYELCGEGQKQSPIDLTTENQAPPTNGLSPIWFSNAFLNDEATGKLFQNGHTLEFKTDLPNKFTFSGGPFGDNEYQFNQLHFHWGSTDTQGSEHTINGIQFPMEMHMVCINSKYVNEDGSLNALYSTESDGVAVLGFMFEIYKRRTGWYFKTYHPLANILERIPDLYNTEGDGETNDVDVVMKPGPFIRLVAKRGYYTYNGSFTTPACNEVVTWVNWKHPIQVSRDMIDTFRQISDDEKLPIDDNFRPVQPLNGRSILEY